MPNPDDFCIVPFHEGAEIDGFDCGNKDLNDFLTTQEVTEYRAQWYGYTYLVHRASDWALVGYYTTANDGLEIPDDWVKKRMNPTLGLTKVPAVLLGRIAVATDFQRNGHGSMILKHIMTVELESPRPPRVMRLTAYQESLEWYLRRGFDFISDKEKRKAGQAGARPRLYFDLRALPGSPGVRIPKQPSP